jgi:AraC-like DNA-binding protein
MERSFTTIRSSKTLDNAIDLLKMGCCIKPLDESGERFAYGLNHKVLHLRAEPVILVIAECAKTRQQIRTYLGAGFRLAEAVNHSDAKLLTSHFNPALILVATSATMDDDSSSSIEHVRQAGTAPAPVFLLTAKVMASIQAAKVVSSAPTQISSLSVTNKTLPTYPSVVRAGKRQQLYRQAQDLRLRDKTFLENLNQVLLSKIDQEQVKVAELASAVNMSMRTLNRKVKALVGKTPKQLLQSQRLDFAADLLAFEDMSITEVSYSVGFADASYFSRKFKVRFHQTPKEYKDSSDHTRLVVQGVRQKRLRQLGC